MGPGGGAVCRLAGHPGGRRLLVHAVHPTAPLVILDLRTGSVMQTYPDLQTFRLPASSCVSPCGSWVLAGSSCGAALLWNTDTGAKGHVYKDLPYARPVSAVAWHPLDQAVAFGSIEPHVKVQEAAAAAYPQEQ